MFKKFSMILCFLTSSCHSFTFNFSSVQFSHTVMSDSLQPHGPHHARPPYPSPAPRVYPESCSLSPWCHPTISSSVVPLSSCPQSFPASGSFLFFKIYFNWRLITLQYCGGLCHTFTWISHGCTWVLHPDTPSHLTPHPIAQDHPSAPALSTLSHASNLDWPSISHMIMIFTYEYVSMLFSQVIPPLPSPTEPKSLFFTSVSLLLCLLLSLTYRVIITIFLNSIYMR